MAAYLAPGVYLRPRRTVAPDVRLVRTDVAGFVGVAERGPLALPSLARALGRPVADVRPEDVAVRLTSWDEYRATFGGLIPYGYLPYAVRGFFENGGTTCHVVRLAALRHPDPEERPEVATWVFRGVGPAAATGTLAETAAAGSRVLRTPLAGALARGTAGVREPALVEVTPADGSGSELHVLLPADGARSTGLHLSAGLRRTYEAGATVRLHDAALAIEARSAGNWGNRIRLQITPAVTAAGVLDFALRVTLESGPDPSHPREEEFYRHLSLDPRDTARRPRAAAAPGDRVLRWNPAYAPGLVNERSRLIRIVFPPGPTDAAPPDRIAPVPLLVDRALHDAPVRLEGGRDGLRGLSPEGGAIGHDWLDALQVLDPIDEVSILCAPDLVFEAPVAWRSPVPPRPAPCAAPRPAPPPDPIAEDPTAIPPGLGPAAIFGFQTAMLEQCERRRDRVAILDLPASARTAGDLLRWRGDASSLPATARRFAACYAPWLEIADPVVRSARRQVPPSGHVAGVYAQIDNAFAVHRPPANVALAGGAAVAETLTAQDQESLNPRGINLLRAFPGRGVRVWGARSLSDEPEWRFIHVRRVMSMIQESVEESTQWTVFEPNDDALRRTVVHAVSVFLREIWQQGGLRGSAPEEAFFVRCDETNNPPAVVDAGQVVCQVGVAVAAPMEFLVFEIRQTASGADIVEG